MDFDAFYNLYVNVNCMAELGLRFVEENMDDFFNGLGEVGENELEEFVSARFDGLRLSAGEGLPFLDGMSDQQAELDEMVKQNNQVVDNKPITVAMKEGSSLDAKSNLESKQGRIESFDLDSYMSNAYFSAESQKAHIEVVYYELDQVKLVGFVEKLDATLPSLTDRLNGPQMNQWLEVYKQDDSTLDEIVLLIRRTGEHSINL